MKKTTSLSNLNYSENLSKQFNISDWAQAKTSTKVTDILAHFLLYLNSKHTKLNYGIDILEFLDFCSTLNINIINISDINEKIVLLWKNELEHRHTKHVGNKISSVSSSIARHLSSLSSLLNFAVKRKLLTENCVMLINRPKIKRDSKTNALTMDELKKIFIISEKIIAKYSCNKNTRYYRSAKLKYVILATLVSVGMRVSELCELRICDLERVGNNYRLNMITKGHEEHAPYINQSTTNILLDYISEFRSYADKNDYLFIRAQNLKQTYKLTSRAVYHIIYQLSKMADINKKISPHSCRATTATIMHKSGIPIGEIQTLLNHKNISTTAIYIKKLQELDESAALKLDFMNIIENNRKNE